MSFITILNVFLLPCLITILVIGAILNSKYIKSNIYQKYLVGTLSFWAFIMIFVYAKFFIDDASTISYTRDVCSVQVLLLGIPSFFSLISYPVTILNAKYLTIKHWRRVITPMLIAVSIYFGYHLIAGEDPFVKYSTLGELFANITSISVILRLTIFIMFAYYCSRDLRGIWRVVPLYNQYVQDNISDSECNVGWIRNLVLYISGVMCSYFALLFFSSPIVNCIYIFAVILLFFYIVEMSLLRRTSEHIERLEIVRDQEHPDGYFINASNIAAVENSIKQVDDTITIDQIDKWMEKQAPYVNADFTTADIIEAFPTLTNVTLTNIFRSKDTIFQSYVRRFRIIKACELLDRESGKAYPKNTYAMVGFSHHSSFSRSFVSVVGMAPSEYLKLPKEEANIILSQIINNR